MKRTRTLVLETLETRKLLSQNPVMRGYTVDDAGQIVRDVPGQVSTAPVGPMGPGPIIDYQPAVIGPPGSYPMVPLIPFDPYPDQVQPAYAQTGMLVMMTSA